MKKNDNLERIRKETESLLWESHNIPGDINVNV